MKHRRISKFQTDRYWIARFRFAEGLVERSCPERGNDKEIMMRRMEFAKIVFTDRVFSTTFDIQPKLKGIFA